MAAEARWRGGGAAALRRDTVLLSRWQTAEQSCMAAAIQVARVCYASPQSLGLPTFFRSFIVRSFFFLCVTTYKSTKWYESYNVTPLRCYDGTYNKQQKLKKKKLIAAARHK